MTTEENLEQIDLENIITGLGAVYLKKHYVKFAAKHPTLTKSRNEKFIQMISSDKFIKTLTDKIKTKILSKYREQFTEQEIDDQFETKIKDQKEVFLEKVRIELDREISK